MGFPSSSWISRDSDMAAPAGGGAAAAANSGDPPDSTTIDFGFDINGRIMSLKFCWNFLSNCKNCSLFGTRLASDLLQFSVEHHVTALQSGAAYHSLGFEDENLGSFPAWWVATVATYCPSRPGELLKFLSSKPCEWSDASRCTLASDLLQCNCTALQMSLGLIR